jgi:oxygen-independent coproporphyrinogen III oxidase
MIQAAPAGVLSSVTPTYAYSYPHKSSYARFQSPVRLAELWREEIARVAALYVHIPFCEMRCGFCNLFTQSQPRVEAVEAYLDSLIRQMRIVSGELPRLSYGQLAIGGGTPTYLSALQLRRLMESLERQFGIRIAGCGASVETSPATTDSERLGVLSEFGVHRISIGVQALDERDLRRFGRPQSARAAFAALELIRRHSFGVLNIDLIYGDDDQEVADFTTSIRTALQVEPEELYLYPLYVRPLTGLGLRGRVLSQHRSDLYRAGRDILLESGYEQLSMRCFRRRDVADEAGGEYQCQSDAAVGLGCGGRSYTRATHYSSKFAVTQQGIRAILGEWIGSTDDEFRFATHGIRLPIDEQRRRFVILSLLDQAGLDEARYQRTFGSPPEDHFSVLNDLVEEDYVVRRDGRLVLTPSGMEWSDRVGPLLYSDEVRRRLEMFPE